MNNLSPRCVVVLGFLVLFVGCGEGATPARSDAGLGDGGVVDPVEDAGGNGDGGSGDAGGPDAGACVAEAERCDGVDRDCDGRIDEGDDAVLCAATERGSATCRAGECVPRAWGWAHAWVGPEEDQAIAVASDGAGNVYVGGKLGRAVDFGDGVHESRFGSAAVVVSYDAAGDLRWARSMGDLGEQIVMAVSVASDGSVLALVRSTKPNGVSAAQVDFGGGVRVTSTQACYVVELRADGEYVEDHRVTDGRFWCHGMAVSDRTIVIGGHLWWTGADLGSGHRVSDHPGAAAFVVLDRETMTARWERVIDARSAVITVALDSGGGVLIGGQAEGSFDLGGGAREPAAQGGFVASYSGDGVHRWDRLFDTDEDEFVRAIVGHGTDVTAIVQAVLPSTRNAFVVTLDSAGSERWRVPLGSVWANASAVGPDGQVAIAGEAFADIDFGGGLRRTEGQMSFLLVLSADGRYRWDLVGGVGSRTAAAGGSVAMTRVPAGWIIVGEFFRTLDLGTRVLDGYEGDGYSDGYVLLVEDDEGLR